MSKTFSEIGKHIVNGITKVIPFIVLYSIFVTLATYGVSIRVSEFIWVLIIPLLTASIANSISPKISVIPGLLLGYIVEGFGIGFFGGIFAGLLLGYCIQCIASRIKIQRSIIMIFVGYVILGFLGFVFSYLVMNYMVKDGLLMILDTVFRYVDGIEESRTVYLIVILSLLMVVDLGGPFNKLSYSLVIPLYTERHLYHITGPVMISVSLAPLTVFVGMVFVKGFFSSKDLKSKYYALFGGLVGLTEGALAVGYRRPLHVILPLLIGTLAATSFAGYNQVENTSIMTSIPGLLGTNKPMMYVLSYVIGVSVTIVIWVIMNQTKNLKNK